MEPGELGLETGMCGYARLVMNAGRHTSCIFFACTQVISLGAHSGHGTFTYGGYKVTDAQAFPCPRSRHNTTFPQGHTGGGRQPGDLQGRQVHVLLFDARAPTALARQEVMGSQSLLKLHRNGYAGKPLISASGEAKRGLGKQHAAAHVRWTRPLGNVVKVRALW